MNMQHDDPYAALGLGPEAGQAEITSTFRALLRSHHPDTRPRQPGTRVGASDAALQRVIAAYTVLRDPQRRAAYDAKAAAARDEPPPAVQPAARRPAQARRSGRSPIQAGPVYWQPSHKAST
jgi:DnaJ-class molecular chaperone